ncbi:MAG: DEAD/DEAH box helicase [Phycisphaeraceae bacterium]|nr:DEAD/DEAH box helicase [Phycisphaeraceae bacterium]
MIVLHANWCDGALCLWAERSEPATTPPTEVGAHPFSCDAAEIRRAIALIGVDPQGLVARVRTVLLPVGAAVTTPIASARLARLMGQEQAEATELGTFRVECLAAGPELALRLLDQLLESLSPDGESNETAGDDTLVFAGAVGSLARHMLAQQRFVPMLAQEIDGTLRASWRGWLDDGAVGEDAMRLSRAMPAAFRAATDDLNHDASAIVDDMLWRLIDAECRRVLTHEALFETVQGREPDDPHVAWLRGLLDGDDRVCAPASVRSDLVRGVRQWIARLDERGASAQWRLCLRLEDPAEGASVNGSTPDDLRWTLRFMLQAVEAPGVLIPADEIWLLSTDLLMIEGHRLEQPQEILLAELARASRLYRPIERALEGSEPSAIELDTRKAYEFLREHRPVLIEQGFGAIAPDWWESPRSRLGARLRLDSDPMPPEEGTSNGSGPPSLGVSTLVGYQWEIAVGDTSLTLKEFEELAARRMPLIRLGGRWVEIRPEDVEHAVRFIRQNPGGTMPLGEAMRLAFATDLRQTGVPVVGLEASGWLGSLLGPTGASESLPDVEQPGSFVGTLRPYQVRGLSWMHFMERFGFGVCLADDMGLGKTIQLLALMALEREQANGAGVGATLLIAPTSVLGNWTRETRRFVPGLRVYVHHGTERFQGQHLADTAAESDLIITTYALAYRDRESLEPIRWGRVVLDEAQFIKNPAAKQTNAVRTLLADRRIALTGTPVENRLSELWSIMDFLNPGYLGPASSFRTRFAVPIERHHDAQKGERLRGLVRPFILRRLKTDPTVVSDLPEKIESREYCHLTGEQAELYQSCVRRMLSEVEVAEGIERRGLVLAALIRLKQICNHPSQILKDYDPESPEPPLAARSGKSVRLVEQLEEVLAEGERALVFTQFRQMGHLLVRMLAHELDRDILFLHGGTPRQQREDLIHRFQNPDSDTPILVLSLRAGGVGLNLTAATHVFHFDRWWNPAVENQATDRAYRIGQTRTVFVHKYVVRGTLEEKIDEMIEQKTELAENIIGSGERWLTELNTDDLREILTLREEAVADE